MEPASTAVITWGTVKMIGYFVGAALAVASFAWGVHYVGKSNKTAIAALGNDIAVECKERKAGEAKLHERIDRKVEKFESCVRRMEAKQDNTNAMLHMILGHLGIGIDGKKQES